jgi:hypothetical protein
MRLVYKFSLALFCLAISYASLHAEGWGEYNKTVKKEFAISSNGTVYLANKYGKVDVKTWDRNRVKLDIRISVRTNSESNAQKVFNRININFSNTSDLVKAITEIEPKKSNSIFGGWGNDKSDYTIDYEVYLPVSCQLELSNKYGDVYVDKMNAPIKLNIAHGSFKMDGSSDDVRVDVKHSNGTLGAGKNVYFSIKHSNLKLLRAEDVEFSSKHSNITIEKANSIRCSSKYDNYIIESAREIRNSGKYDNFEIGSVDEISVSAKYTSVKALKVNKSIDFNMEHGGGSIRKLSSDFTDVQLDGRHSDFRIGVEDGATFQLEALGEYAGIRYPSELTTTYEVEKGSKHEVKGYMGSSSASKKIRAGLSYGGLRITKE